MPIRSRVAALAVFHLGLVLAGWVAVRAIIGSWGNVPFVVGTVVIAALALVVWWATGRALSTPIRCETDEFIGRGVRWGAIAGIVLWLALLGALALLTLAAALFADEEGVEYNLFGGKYAFVVLPLLVALPGSLPAALLGAALGGVIGIIDRALLPVAHWGSGSS